MAQAGQHPALAEAGVVVSAASGVAAPTAEEAEALSRIAPSLKPVAMGDLVGHSVEAAFPAAMALAAALVSSGAARSAMVSGVGHQRGEGLASLSAIQGE